MLPALVNTTLAEAINASYARTISLVDDTRAKAGESIQEAVRCGHLLNKAKQDCGHGRWLKWLRENCPAITERTAQKWMRLAETNHGSDLKNAAGLRQAYILAGIIDEGESHMHHSQGGSAQDLDRLALPIGKLRSWFDVRIQRTPINQWSREEREATKAQLQPLIDLYQQL